MEALVVIGFWLTIFAVAILAGHHERDARTKLFANFAAQHDGRLLQAATLFSPHPEVGLSHAGRQVSLIETSSGGKNPVFYTEARLYVGQVNPLGYRFEIYPETFFSTVGKFFGMQDVVVGETHFDDIFIVQTNDPSTVKNVFDDRTRMLVRQLYELFGTNNVYLQLDRYWLTVKKDFRVEEIRKLEVYYNLATSIFDSVLAMLGAKTSIEESAEGMGITFLTDGKEADRAEGLPVCQVCGAEIENASDEVQCSYCKTPHHRDCWEYNGSCSTYGCRGTTCVIPKHRRLS